MVRRTGPPPQVHRAEHMHRQPCLHPQHTQHGPCTMQPKMADASQTRKPPAAPPVYSPQPVPRVLQTKLANASQRPVELRPNSTRPVAPRISTPRPQPAVSPPRVNAVQSKAIDSRIGQAVPTVARPITQRTVVQRFRSGIVQATKFYPNLHPGAAIPVDRSNIFTLDSFADQYRLHKINSHSVNVPNMKYNFVRTREGQMLLHNRYRHPSLAEGQQVLYAGEVFFNNGRLEWWSNGSGHYQPDADGAEQANLPINYFYSYQEIIKGKHLQKRA
jgi:hypothetical protein